MWLDRYRKTFTLRFMKRTTSDTQGKKWKLMTPMSMSLSWKHLRQLSHSVQHSSGPEIKMKHILCVIPTPEQHGESARSYTLDELTLDSIQKKYNAWKISK